MKKIYFLLIAFLFFGCRADGEKSNQNCDYSNKLKIATWNIQTFFDANKDGNEYSEFVTSKTWGKDSYITRLKRLCEVIKKIDADIFVMEELENEAQLFDISNFLAGEWNGKKIYKYGCFSKEENSSIGCGILSRINLSGMKVHNLEVQSENEMQPKLRPILEVQINENGKELILLVNHWKSKSGGEEKTEKWRNREEGILAEIVHEISHKNSAILIVGDFNRDILDFCIDKKNAQNENTTLRFFRNNSLQKEGVKVHSTWFNSDGTLIEPGSYYFNKEWSRIDNIFTAGPIQVLDFYPETEGPWCNEENFIPYKFSLWNGKGYSDHLPLFCMIKF